MYLDHERVFAKQKRAKCLRVSVANEQVKTTTASEQQQASNTANNKQATTSNTANSKQQATNSNNKDTSNSNGKQAMAMATDNSKATNKIQPDRPLELCGSGLAGCFLFVSFVR